MRPLHKTLNLDSKEYHLLHSRIVNCLSNDLLSSKELELVSEFVRLGGINTENRGTIGENLNISASNMSNYVRSLRKKGVVIKQGSKFMIKNVFYPSTKTQTYQITLHESNHPANS